MCTCTPAVLWPCFKECWHNHKKCWWTEIKKYIKERKKIYRLAWWRVTVQAPSSRLFIVISACPAKVTVYLNCIWETIKNTESWITYGNKYTEKTHRQIYLYDNQLSRLVWKNLILKNESKQYNAIWGFHIHSNNKILTRVPAWMQQFHWLNG